MLRGEAFGIAAAGLLHCAWSDAAPAQDGDASNAANNPLIPSITVNFHDYYVPSIIDVLQSTVWHEGEGMPR